MKYTYQIWNEYLIDVDYGTRDTLQDAMIGVADYFKARHRNPDFLTLQEFEKEWEWNEQRGCYVTTVDFFECFIFPTAQEPTE